MSNHTGPIQGTVSQQPRSAFLEFLQAITGVFVVVYDGQHALKFTLGRAGNVVGPGVHWKWPIIQAYRVADTRHTTIELEKQAIQLRDDLVYEIGARAVYQIMDLRRALIEIDNLFVGLRNRMVIAVQRVVKTQDRESIRDLNAMVAAVLAELAPVEAQWGIKIHEFGFSTLSPTPETLEITQLRKLAEEKLTLYQQFRETGQLDATAAVALISGSVVALRPAESQDRLPKAEAARDEPPTLFDFDEASPS
jgi:regulator of protease activity HflC (stomatin/prohibitin superfamily)